MKSLLIINTAQFGYHIDTYYYCKYLNTEYEITYVCWDFERPRIVLPKINIIYLSRKNNLLLRNIKLIINLIKIVYAKKPDIVFFVYFRLCSIVKIMLLNRFICVLDVRTVTINKNKFYRFIFDNFLRFEQMFFKNLTVISEEIRKYLKLKKDKCYILPLGADIISSKDKDFSKFNLIYVGTYFYRQIDKFLAGYGKFINKYKDINSKIFLIGNIDKISLEKISKVIKKYNLDKRVICPGYIHHKNLKSIYEECSFGISYVPITSYYNLQPPTKTYEYLMSGLAVIATGTYENKKIINDTNGLIFNNDDEIEYILEKLYLNRGKFISSKIRDTVKQYSWVNIIKDFSTYLNRINNCKRIK